MEEYLKKNVLGSDEKLINKFNSMLNYFTCLSPEDLELLDLDEFVTIPPPTERGIMLLFIRKYLSPHFDGLQYKEVKRESQYRPSFSNTPRLFNNRTKSPFLIAASELFKLCLILSRIKSTSSNISNRSGIFLMLL